MLSRIKFSGEPDGQWPTIVGLLVSRWSPTLGDVIHDYGLEKIGGLRRGRNEGCDGEGKRGCDVKGEN